MKQWHYNNPYMYLIIYKNQLFVFLEKAQLFIPTFAEYEYAILFKEKYLPNKQAEILCVDMFTGVNFLKKLVIENKYTPKIGIYNGTLTCMNSQEYIDSFYQYKKSYIDILNLLLEKGLPISEDTMISILLHSPFYVLTRNNLLSKNSYYKLFKNKNKEVIDINYTVNKNTMDIIQDDNKIIIFTNEEEFLKYKSEYNLDNIGIKKYWNISDLLLKLNKTNILVNPSSICKTINFCN